MATSKVTTVTPEKWREVFLERLAGWPNVSAACRAARVSRTQAYRVYYSDEKFHEQWEIAKKLGVAALEDSVFNRAKESDLLAIFLLKAHAPETYRETQRVEQTGSGGGPIRVDVGITLDVAAQLLDILDGAS